LGTGLPPCTSRAWEACWFEEQEGSEHAKAPHDEPCSPQAYVGSDEAAVGAAEGHIRAEEGRSPSQESSCSQADESSGAKEVIGARQGAVGCGEEGWRYVFIAPKLMTGTFRVTAYPFSRP